MYIETVSNLLKNSTLQTSGRDGSNIMCNLVASENIKNNSIYLTCCY